MALMTSQKNEWLRLLFSLEPYKPGKGTYARQGSFAAFVVMIVYGAYSFSQMQSDPTMKWGVPVAVGLVATWLAYRVVHYPRFAEFLINTEAEIGKVSWPSWKELKASTAVVVIMVVIMGTYLFLVDTFWKWLLGGVLGILKIGGLFGGGGSGM
jgi:preprotein translocase subunit SecE